MRALRPLGLLVAVAGAGFAGTIAAGAAAGLHRGGLAHLAALIVPALAVTVLATGLARMALGRASIRVSIAAVAVVGAAAGLANLAALAMLMIVSRPDATVVGVLLIYAAAAGVGAALALGSARAQAIGRLASVAQDLGKGHLSARAGALEAGPELEMLARTLDDMAGRLQDALTRERTIEARRRDLMTAISHDLRTPLSSLRAMVEAIDDEVVTDPPSLRRYTAEMRRSVIQLATMVDDLFELAQLEARVIDAETQRTTLEDVVLSAMAAVEFQAAEKHLALRADLGGHGDTACSPRLARVLQNLLANAVRHTPADGAVLIEASRWQTGLEVAVEDTGPGIDPEDLSRIFEPFYRADPARTGAGAGLGLALAKRIAEALGGRLDVENKPQAGARFAIRIPPPAAASRPVQSS
jgi:signal transduction histidine kinase